jgi:hypothetical protein
MLTILNFADTFEFPELPILNVIFVQDTGKELLDE